jgi:hypothetical protein
MKNAILSWLAEVAHALLTKPLVVAITTAMTGATGTAGAATNAVSGASNLSGLSNIGSLFSSIYSLGSTFISGLSEGIMGMFSTNMFSTLGTAWGAVTSGSATGAAAGLGVMSAYALPILAIAAPILGKYFQDQKPRYGAYAATTTGRTDQFEDEVGVKGGFGLTFGMNDMGTANVDAEEMRQLFEGFAAVSTALENFYGKDVSSQVTESLSKASMENWGKNGLMNYAMNAEQAFQIAFADIIKHAAATGDAVAVVMSSVVGSLQGTMEDMANQIERGMLAAKAAVGMAEAFQGQEIGDRLGLGAKDTLGNALKLVDYAKAMQTSGETTAEAIGRMALNLGVLDAAMTLTGTQTDATGMAFIDLANSLAKVADDAKIGMQGLMQLQAAYYQNFFTEEERAIKQKENSLKAIERWNKDQGLDGIDTSAEFRAYVESLDLTTEAGQKAYVEAMKIVAAFISLDDALKKIGDTIPDVIDAFEAQRKTLRDMADQLDPSDPLSADQRQAAQDALRKAGYAGDIYDAKGLAAFLRALSELDDAGGDAGAELQKFIDTFTGVFDELARIAQERAGLEMRLLELTGTQAEILAAKRQLEFEAIDATNRALLLRIYALEDARLAMDNAFTQLEKAINAERDAVQEEYQRRVDAINAEREALANAHQERLEAINAEREALQTQISAAQESLTKIQGILGSVQSALDSLRGQMAVTDIALAAARRQLASWARQGILPDQEAFDRVMGTLGRDDKGNYATATAYRTSQQATYANLLALEKAGLTQKTTAERQLEAMEAQNDALDDQLTQADRINQDQLDALDEQLKQADTWRNDELERLDKILEDAKKAMEITLGIYEEVMTIDDALKALNQTMVDYLTRRDAHPALAPTNDPMGAAPLAQQSDLAGLRAEIVELRNVVASVGTAQITPLKSIDDRLRKFDTDGLPPGRDDVVLLRAA